MRWSSPEGSLVERVSPRRFRTEAGSPEGFSPEGFHPKGRSSEGFQRERVFPEGSPVGEARA